MNAQSKDMLADSIVLRVLGGRQDGANYRLVRGVRVTLGYGFNHDIVLRTQATKGLSLVLELDEALASVTLISGYADILGRAVAAGETIKLPLYMPLGFGNVACAIGDPLSERWNDASSISAAMEARADAAVPAENVAIVPSFVPADFLIQLTTRGQAISDRLNWEKRWPIVALAAAVLLLSVMIFPVVSSWIGEESNGKAAVEQSLLSAGFGELKVSQKEDGGILVTGLLKNDDALNRLRRLTSKFQNAEIDVDTMEGLAASAQGILSSQNIDAEVRPGRGKSLVVDGEFLPLDRQEELSQMIRKDMPLIANIIFKTNDARGDQDLQYFFSNPQYGLAAYVDGDPAYIKTADGSTWYKGAQVPTGHVITNIGNGSIQFERAGRTEILKVAEPELTDEAATPELNKVE